MNKEYTREVTFTGQPARKHTSSCFPTQTAKELKKQIPRRLILRD